MPAPDIFSDDNPRSKSEKPSEHPKPVEYAASMLKRAESIIEKPYKGSKIEKDAKKYLDAQLAGADPEGKKIFEESAKTFEVMTSAQLQMLIRKYQPNIDRLNTFGWKPDSCGLVVDTKEQVLYILYKNSQGQIELSARCRVGLGRGPLGSNEDGSGGTPFGMLRMFVNPAALTDVDQLGIGVNKNPKGRRGKGGIVTRWMHTEGLEERNSNSRPEKRGIMFHGKGQMDDFRAGYDSTAQVPTSSGCVVMSNADVLRIWSFVRGNLFAKKPLLCDVVPPAERLARN